MSNRAKAGLELDIDSSKAVIATRRLDALEKSTDEYAKAAKDAEDQSKSWSESLTSVGTSIQDAAVNSNSLTGALGRLPLGAVSTAALGVAGAVVGAGIAIVGLANKTREAAREINQGLLDAIEDAARGSEELTERFETAENTMRQIRGETDLLARGYTDLDEALADSTAEFARNEAVIRDIDSIIPRLGETIQRGLVAAYAALRREAVETNAELIQSRIAAEEAIASMARLAEAFGSGFGAERAAGVLDNLHTSSEAVREAFAAFSGELGLATEEEIQFIATTETLNLSMDRVFAAMAEGGQITRETADAASDYARTERGRLEVMLLIQSANEDLNEIQLDAYRAMEQSTGAASANAEALGEIVVVADKVTAAIKAQDDAMREQVVQLAEIREHKAQLATLNEQLASQAVDLALKMKAEADGQQKLADALKLEESDLAAFEAQIATMEQRVQLGASLIASSFQTIGASIGEALTGDGERASKVILGLIGDILVALGSAAMAQGAIAVIPTLINPAGTPVQGAALLAAGAVAIGVGSAMGAATRSQPSRSIPNQAPSTSEAPSSTVNNYSVRFDSMMPERGYNRHVVERVGGALESAA